MPKSIKVPATIEEVVAKLEGTEALLTATEWERTILIRAATKEGRGGPRTASNVMQLTIRQFADEGLSGLKSQNTIRAYRNVWEWAMENLGVEDVEPGDRVDLPDEPWLDNQGESMLTRFGGTGHAKRYVEKDEKAVGRSLARRELDADVLAQNLDDETAAAVVARLTEDRPKLVRTIERRAAIQEAVDEEDVETLSKATASAAKNRMVTRRRKRLAGGDDPNPKPPKILDAASNAFLFVGSHIGDAGRSLERFVREYEALTDDVKNDADFHDSCNESFDMVEIRLQAARAAVNGASEDELNAILGRE